eukprot:g6768.t1
MPFCPLLLPFCPITNLFPFYALVRTHVARQVRHSPAPPPPVTVLAGATGGVFVGFWQVPPGCSTSHSAARRATRLLVEPLSCSSSHSAARRATQLLVEPLSCSTGLKTFWRAVPPEPLCQNRDMSAVTLHYTILVTVLAGARFRPTPPEKGSFPLDHMAECRKAAEDYLQCLKTTEGKT